MSKLPKVTRDSITGGLTHESAAKWMLFIADEADFDGDSGLAEAYRQRAATCMKFPNGSVHDKKLEAEIEEWMKKNAQA